jgi:hypothetical protein
MFEIDGGTEKYGSWYQRLAKVVLDVCVSVLGPFVSKFANVKVPQGSKESKYRVSKHDINYSDSTKPRVCAAWTQGSLSALRVGELFAPEHPSLPRGSLEQWITKLKLKEGHRESATSPSPLPQIEKLRTFSSIDAMEDESRENGDIDSLDVHEMAAAKDEATKDFLRDKMSEGLPVVYDSLDASD